MSTNNQNYESDPGVTWDVSLLRTSSIMYSVINNDAFPFWVDRVFL